MIRRFVNRQQEIKFLKKHWNSGKAELLILYGRRRIGKTALCQKFGENKNYHYWFVNKSSGSLNRKNLTQVLSTSLNRPILKATTFDTWTDLFKTIVEYIKDKRHIFVFDEIQNLILNDDTFLTQFQEVWDSVYQKLSIMIIFTGSSISIIENELIAYRSPIYGRRTGQWKLRPLTLLDCKEFFPTYSLKQLIEVYSLVDGVPYYLSLLDDQLTPLENLKTHIATPGEVLFQEVDFLLMQELRKPQQYKLIIEGIASGKHTIKEISEYTKIERNNLFSYLETLIQLHIISKEYPVTVEKPKPNLTRYIITDAYFLTWFRLLEPYRMILEGYTGQNEITQTQLDYHVSKVFEKISIQLTIILAKKDLFPFYPTKIGRWWDKNVEIDILALDEVNNNLLCVECKWQTKPITPEVWKNLKIKSESVSWKKSVRRTYFAIFSKQKCSQKIIDKANKENVQVFDIDRIQSILFNLG